VQLTGANESAVYGLLLLVLAFLFLLPFSCWQIRRRTSWVFVSACGCFPA